MTIWNDPEDSQWGQLSERVCKFVEQKTGYDGLTVKVFPDNRSEQDKKKDPMPPGFFYRDGLMLGFDASATLPKSMGDLSGLNPAFPLSQRAFPAFMGVISHEASHVMYTHWDKDVKTTSTVRSWTKTLEEPRIEKKYVEAFPQHRIHLGAAMKHIFDAGILNGGFADMKDETRLRKSTASALALIHGRVLGHVLEEEVSAEIVRISKMVFGEDHDKLVEIILEFLEIEDNDTAFKYETAKKYSDIVDPDAEDEEENEEQEQGSCSHPAPPSGPGFPSQDSSDSNGSGTPTPEESDEESSNESGTGESSASSEDDGNDENDESEDSNENSNDEDASEPEEQDDSEDGSSSESGGDSDESDNASDETGNDSETGSDNSPNDDSSEDDQPVDPRIQALQEILKKAVSESLDKAAEPANEAMAGKKDDAPDYNPREQTNPERQEINASAKGVLNGRYLVTPKLPTATDISYSRAIIAGMRKARYRDVNRTRVSSMTGPGRLNIRGAMKRQVQVSNGQRPTAEPWNSIRRREAENPPLSLGVAVDISGSMDAWQKHVSTFAWAFSQAVIQEGGRVSAVAWNDSPHEIIQAGYSRNHIPVATTNGGSRGLPKSMNYLDSQLGLTFGQGPRLLVVITDGGISPTEREVQKISARMLREEARILWVSTSAYGWSPKGVERINMNNPADFGRTLGEGILQALSDK